MIQTDTGNKTTLRNYEIALIQMDTQNDKGENMKKACRFIDEAARPRSEDICFPEVMNLHWQKYRRRRRKGRNSRLYLRYSLQESQRA